MIEALLLVLVANGTPVLAKRLLGHRLAYPLDAGLSAPDGHPWLGRSITIRGILLAVLATAVAAFVMGIDWRVGGMIGLLAMVGDLLSSFIKRRLGMPVSSQAPGLDQVPEALLPLAVYAGPLGLLWYEVVLLVAAFWILEVFLSRLLYRLHIRNHPY